MPKLSLAGRYRSRAKTIRARIEAIRKDAADLARFADEAGLKPEAATARMVDGHLLSADLALHRESIRPEGQR